MVEESTNRTPLICFLSMGSDPTDSIERLAKSKGISKFSRNDANVTMLDENFCLRRVIKVKSFFNGL